MTRRHETEFSHPALAAETVPGLLASTVDRQPTAVAQRYKGGVYDRSLTAMDAVPAAPRGGFADLTYSELATVVDRLAAGLRLSGLGTGDRLAIASHTRMEWTHLDLATLSAGGVVAPIYPSATTERFAYLLSDCEPTGIVVENAELLGRLLAIEDSIEFEFAFICVIDSLPAGSGMAAAARDRDDILTVGALYDRGAASADADRVDRAAIEPDDLASLVYTSGTTGQPRAVRLTHRNFCANVDQAFRRFGPRPDRTDGPWIDHTTQHLSVLPLAHVFERLAGSYLLLAAGATIAYAGSTDTLPADFQLVEPTLITGVPKLYQQLFERVAATASESVVGGRLFQWATAVAGRYHRAETPSRRLRLAHTVADRLVYQSVRDGLGGNVALCISGGDSLSPELCAIFNGMAVPIVEGYGLTEAAPVVSANRPEAPETGTIGPPLSGLDVRIVPDIDDDVDTNPPRADWADAEATVGELLVRGPNVTDGYWNAPEATDQAFVSLPDDTDGESRWLRTGDIVERRPSGSLVFRARRTELVGLSTGKNVAPAPLETALESDPLIEQCVVVGSGRPFVAALVVPAFDAVRQWAASEGLTLPDERDQLVAVDRLQRRIERAVDAHNDSFEPHERIGAIQLVAEPFSVDNALLTPTLKPRRGKIADRYAAEIDALYDTN